MKWIAAILMVVNAAVFLWAGGRQVATEEVITSSKPVINMEGMLLLSEVNSSNQTGTIPNSDGQKSDSTPIPSNETNAPVETAFIESGAENNETSQSDLIVTEDLLHDGEVNDDDIESLVVGTLSDVKACYRVGPFRKPATWQSATKWMQEQEITFKHIVSESRGLRAVRVYLGPFESRAATAPNVQLLKDRGLDYFIYSDDYGAVRMSLGYFTQEALATKFLTYLSSIEIAAKSEPEYRQLGPFNWMEVPASEVRLNQLTNHEWTKPDIGLTQIGCESSSGTPIDLN